MMPQNIKKDKILYIILGLNHKARFKRFGRERNLKKEDVTTELKFRLASVRKREVRMG
jgi:hypothetical protein